MKKPIIQRAIGTALARLLNLSNFAASTSTTQRVVPIDIAPWELQSFMIENNIPQDARLHHEDDQFFLIYDVTIPDDDAEVVAQKIKAAFNNSSFKYVSDAMRELGYNRKSLAVSNYRKALEFDVYDVYTSNRDDRFELLYDYYGYYFDYVS
jgi:hypothetical protein